MKIKPFVLYGSIKIKSISPMHMGGEEKDELVRNGNGNYIMPASSIAGAIKHVIKHPLFGRENGNNKNDDTNSYVYFYDAELPKGAEVEKRVGIRRDARLGTAEQGGLYSTFYITEGVDVEIKMQMFLDDKQTGLELFKEIAECIQNKTITFGAKKSHGSGMFDVQKAACKILDLHQQEDFLLYCQGVKAVMNYLEPITVEARQNDYGTVYQLEAKINGSLLVKSNETPEQTDDEYVPDVQNMYKMVNGQKQYYIPGSTIKGLMRAYANVICKHQHIDETVVDEIFGGEVNGVKKASSVFFSDVDISNVKKVIYHRVPIDRWLGGTIEGQKLDIEAISSHDIVTITVRIKKDIDERLTHLANAFAYLTLRDLGNGRLSIGSYDSIGFGRFEGRNLYIDQAKCPFVKQNLECGSLSSQIMEHLKVLGGDAHA